MADFLLELFSEEIPARMQEAAADGLLDDITKALKEAGIAFGKSDIFSSPRHLAIRLGDLPAEQPDRVIERKGPGVNSPQGAIDGFLKSTGLTLDQLEVRGNVYFAVTQQKGQKTALALKPMLEKILAGFTWPKSMRWGAHEFAWVRPLHAMTCLLDGDIIPVTLGHVTAGNVTYGHRFLAPDAITLTHPRDYVEKLRAAHVLVDRGERKAKIAAEAHALAAKHSLTLVDDAALLDEVTGLVEWPVLLMGSIDADYMQLPPEVLISEMKHHQRYFALKDASGAMAAKFLITANMPAPDGGKAIIAGNERVLRARLADGRFYWEQDKKTSLSAWNEKLKDVVFHAKIGTVAEKVERVAALAGQIARTAYADHHTLPALAERAARLCKADLATGMVGEFPELQGAMGRYYALAQNEPADIADAIRDHYKPLGPSDTCPNAPVSVCVALADKLDTLVSMFTIGEKPTGSKDPFALRRAALGVIRLILENGLRLAIDPVIAPFVFDRLKVSLRDQGFRHDIVGAVIPADTANTDLASIIARARALDELMATADGESLLAGYRRAVNILRIEEKKDGTEYRAVNNALFEMAEEKTLDTELVTAKTKVHDAVKGEHYVEAMKALATLRAPIDRFFDKVMVNCENKALRASRLGLLNAIRETMDEVAGFALIEDVEKQKEAA